MSTLAVLVVVLILVAVLGGGYYGHSAGYGGPAYYGGFGLGTILIVVLVIWLLRGGL